MCRLLNRAAGGLQAAIRIALFFRAVARWALIRLGAYQAMSEAGVEPIGFWRFHGAITPAIIYRQYAENVRQSHASGMITERIVHAGNGYIPQSANGAQPPRPVSPGSWYFSAALASWISSTARRWPRAITQRLLRDSTQSTTFRCSTSGSRALRLGAVTLDWYFFVDLDNAKDRSSRNTSWQAARCRRRCPWSRSAPIISGTVALSPTRRCSICSTRTTSSHAGVPGRSASACVACRRATCRT